jgi:hypothetical protein
MLTLFSVPKPFEGHIGVIQRNALGSWVRLPEVEIILVGDEPGAAKAAAEVGATHVRTVDRNAYGTPLLDSVFRQVRDLSKQRKLVYVNADVMLFPDLVDAVRRVALVSYLLVGRRWTINVDEPLDFSTDWAAVVREKIADHGKLDSPTSIDYYVLDQLGPFAELPPFAVGRPGWDNWMIYNARRRRIPVVDATRVVTAVHQRHTHEHVPAKTAEPWFGPEADANRALIGDIPIFCTVNATHVLTNRGAWPALAPVYFSAHWRTRRYVDGRLERIFNLLEPAVILSRPIRARFRRARLAATRRRPV